MLKARCYRLAPLLFGGNHILIIFAQNICIRNCFSGSNCKILPALGRGHPLPDPPPARSLRSLAILLADYFRRVSETWNFLIHDEMLENCYEKIVIKSIQNKVDIALYTEHLESQSFTGPLSGPWTPAAIQGICFSPRGVDPGGGGANISFCPPPPPPIISTT